MSCGLSATPAGDTVVKGYLIDGSCAARKAGKPHALAAHSKACLQMPVCKASGYGVVTGERLFIRFVEHLNQMAQEFISHTAREIGIKVAVSGTVHGGKIAVSKIELQ